MNNKKNNPKKINAILSIVIISFFTICGQGYAGESKKNIEHNKYATVESKDGSVKAGFVSIIGKPNVGKSTLMNQLVGERLSIITSKAQTTRHRIMGIISGEDFQVVYSDTPGILKPEYELHQAMMKFVSASM